MTRIVLVTVTISLLLSIATLAQTLALGHRIDQLGERMTAMSHDLRIMNQRLACSDCRPGPAYAEARR